MKTSFTLCVLIPALALIARAEEETFSSAGPALGGGPAILVPVELTEAGVAPAPLMMPHALPHYYGRGESSGFGGGHGHDCGCSGCDGMTWSCCPRPRTYNLHLWDNYCYESTRCGGCGFGLGGMLHSLFCGLGSQCGCGGNGCAHGGCADHGGPANGPAQVAPAPSRDQPAPTPSVEDDDPAMKKKMTPGGKKDLKNAPKDMGTPTPMDPMPKPPMTKEPMKNMPEKSEKEPKKARRVVPSPRKASLLDRLFPSPSSGSR